MADTNPDMPSVGKKAPAFSVQTNTGKEVKLSDFKGKPVVLYFYPKDDTPGCTVEAKGFQANLAKFEKLGAVVLGVSPDGIKSHRKFAEKFGLSFNLLADESHDLCNAYGVWVEKSMYGRKYWGVQRATFLIDANGVTANVWPKVKPEGHAEEVLESIKKLK